MTRPTLHPFILSFAIGTPSRPSGFPSIPLVDCTSLRLLLRRMCKRYAGITPKIEEVFFSDQRNERVFWTVYRGLKSEIRRWDFSKGADFEVPVACMRGCHRSVAMAERLGREISCWEGAPFKLKVCVEHLSMVTHVIKRKHRSEAEYRRYRDLRDIIIIGEHRQVTSRYRTGLGFNVE